MIVEIFSNEVKGRLRPSNATEEIAGTITLGQLAPIFTKMELAVPDEGEHVVKTSEGGYNLMLNDYNAVLRLYPSSKTVDADNSRVTHGYHPRTAAPIGLVQFDGFTMQLMPGLKHARTGIKEAAQDTRDDIGLGDDNEFNYGEINGEARLLDTVLNVDLSIYDTYFSTGVLDRIVEEYTRFEDLQTSFYQAWGGDISFSEFWDDMRAAKEEGRLIDGWNHSHLSMAFESKGNVIDAARAYQASQVNKDDIAVTFD